MLVKTWGPVREDDLLCAMPCTSHDGQASILPYSTTQSSRQTVEEVVLMHHALARDGHVSVLVSKWQPALMHHVGMARPPVEAHLVARLDCDVCELTRLAGVLVPHGAVAHSPHLVACGYVCEQGRAGPLVAASVHEV
eukprot:scaffold3145_cov54-Phaeocystis_antarctica.AAC.2